MDVSVRGAVLGVAVALLVATGGCQTLLGTPTAVDAPEPTRSAAPTASPTPAAVTALPGPDCLTDAAPRPGAVDGVEPLAYPDAPTTVNRSSLVAYVAAVERTHAHDRLLARERPDDARNLTAIDVSTSVRSATPTATGFVVRLSVAAATTYENGAHGDHWMDVAYLVNETTAVRTAVENESSPVDPSAGTVLLRCR